MVIDHDRARNRSDAQIGVAVGLRIKRGLQCIGAALGQGQVGVTGDGFAIDQNAIEKPVLPHRSKHREGGIGKVDIDARFGAAQLVGDGGGGRPEDGILRCLGSLIGSAACREIEQDRHNCGQSQQL